MEFPISDEQLAALEGRLRTALVRPGSPAYDEERSPWNGRIDARPAAIAQCTGVDDVVRAVEFAREHELPLSVKSTGHSYGGFSVRDGSLLLDLSRIDAVQVDPSARRARVGPGVRWGRFDPEVQTFGLATTGATVSTVGVAGFTLGGGTGYLARKFGLGADNLVSAEVVTTNGEVLHASNRENADLFWGLRGGGVQLGVVTSLEFALHDLGPQILAGQIVHPIGQARDALRFWRDFMEEAPNALQCYAFLIHIPPLDAFPPEIHGKVALDLVFAYAGRIDEGERVVAPLRRIGEPILDFAAAQPYAQVQKSFDAGVPAGLRWYSRGHFLDAIGDDLIDVLVHHCDPLPGPFTMVYIEPLKGAISEVAATSTAYAHRNASFSFHILAGWSSPEDDESLMEWTRTFSDAVTPFTSGGVYVNFLSDDEHSRVPEAFGANLERLRQLRKRYDPANLISVL